MKNRAIDNTSEILNADQMSMCRSCRRARRGPRPAALAARPPPRAFVAAAGGPAAAPAPGGGAPAAAPAGAPVAWARGPPVFGIACVVETDAGADSPADAVS